MIKILSVCVEAYAQWGGDCRITDLSMALGYRLEDENRVLTKEEAYEQLGHSASLFKAVIDYVKRHSEN